MEENDPEQLQEEKKPSHLLGYSLLALCIVLIAFELRLQDNSKFESNHVLEQGLPKPILSEYYSGTYKGMQASYTMKNKYGDDLVVNGNRIIVPSVDHTLKLNTDGSITLVQTETSGGQAYYYGGIFEKVSESEDFIELECRLSEKGTNRASDISYHIQLEKRGHSATCTGENQPGFYLTKIRD
ncbi:hypothetical protein J2Y45_003079 [Dyadobacter sp. BE34]|uniref:Uncharacterized protein n=1 Tax=Dyadobacter fermentans TaxID=94254 RepID=A0ABU1QTX0_9BACT|nr:MULTISPECIES: hypothetical protein [Dyadobacter]MDR6804613.1 hypothetical protein [Dyadobacter fermentans]MDR7043628.1 hypothetical protein [Dyadobacter sp. BE242]MDR7197940.1 hypothetical protein [Dyadobacter sp. BE34]MDR7214627.1 hypothetical protein [Dyadobacter sp. BE31]MDR7262162.1 hypothetical protein [Dyadobacter sp. BE32]